VPSSLSRVGTGLVTAPGSHAPLDHGRILHARRGSSSLPLSPTVGWDSPASSRSILPPTTHRQPVLPLGNCSTVNGHWALHSIQPCVGGAVVFPASSCMTSRLLVATVVLRGCLLMGRTALVVTN